MGLGLAVAILSRSYSGATGNYPMALGAIMALLGVIVAGKAFRAANSNKRELIQAPIKFTIAIGACVVYLALLVPLGFYTASVLLMLVLPYLLGFRNPVYLALVTMGFVAIVFIVFTVVLEKPLPTEFWSSTRIGVN